MNLIYKNINPKNILGYIMAFIMVFFTNLSFAQVSNDACANATAIICGGTSSGSTSLATADGPNSSGADVWYSIAGDGSTMTASLCNSSYDTRIWLLDGCGGSVITSNDDGCGSQSTITWVSVIGIDYKICVGGWSSNTGSYTLDVTCVTPPPPPTTGTRL